MIHEIATSSIRRELSGTIFYAPGNEKNGMESYLIYACRCVDVVK